MGASRYIGRIGGLAVALGVGAAVFTGYGVAWAAPTSGGESSTSSGSTSNSSGSSASGTGSESAKTSAGSSTSTGTSTGSGSTSASTSTGAASAATPGVVVGTGGAKTGSKTSLGIVGADRGLESHPILARRPALGASSDASTDAAPTPTRTTGQTTDSDVTPKHQRSESGRSTSTSAAVTANSSASSAATGSGTVAATRVVVTTPPTNTLLTTPSVVVPTTAATASTQSSAQSTPAATTALVTTQPATPSAATPAPSVSTVLASVIDQILNPFAGNTPATPPADPPTAWVLLAAVRRELSGAAVSLAPPSPSTVTPGLDLSNLGTDLSALVSSFDATFAGDQAATAAALLDPSALPAAAAPDFVQLFNQFVYTPIHTGIEDWINSELGQQVDGFVNTVAGSYVIGNGTAGTAADPNGGAAGWLFGDGGAGWNSTEAGVAGGDGGAAGILGNGGAGGEGGAGAAGGAGGAGGSFMGIGGDGGAGGAGTAGGVGGAGGAGGAGAGLLFGVGGNGGDGGNGSDGGRGGDGGNGSSLFGTGGNGGNGGNSGVGGNPTRLPALGGAGGNAGLLGSHGAVGNYGTVDSSGAAPQAQTADPAGSLSPLSTTGTGLTNSDGQVVILHGTNEVYKVAPYEPSASGFSADDAAFLAANGFNVVRLGVIWAAVEPAPGVYDTAYIDSIEQTVQTLNDDGIYVILDFHQDDYSGVFGGEGAPAWASQTGGLPNFDQLGFPINEFANPAETYAWDAFWSNADAPNGLGLEDDYAQMVETVASDFNGDPGVIGFEIMNEPYPGSQLLPTVLGSPFFDTEELNPFYNQVASAIRAVDPTTPIFYEPDITFSLGEPTNLGTVDATNTVFSYHDYALLPILGTVIANNAETYAQAQNIPAFMTEFGATSDQSQIATPMDAANNDLIGWTEWAFTGQGDITTTASPPSSESLVYNPELPPVGDNVNTATLTTLAQPYPQVVSGTPNSWSFSNGTFEFSYSTERADGTGSFPAGAQTTISVPTVEFPNGYQVNVTGGEVVSAPNAPELVIASDGGASTVNVVVTPAAGGESAAA